MRSNEKQTKEKIRHKDIRRDAEFCSILTKELDMEKAPDSYGKALKRIYAELPRDMPVRHYPFRSALKSVAVAAALLFVFGLSLLGANQVYPQLTESLPGLGMVFKHINGTVDDDAAPLPQAVRVIPRGGPHKIPVFTPVQADNPDGNGELTIENAWTDGKEVYLDVSLDVSAYALGLEESTEEAAQPPQAILFSHEEDSTRVDDPGVLAWIEISGSYTDDAVLPLQFDGTSRPVDATMYHYTGVWALQVPKDSKFGESLAIKMDLCNAWGALTERESVNVYLPLSLQFAFEVEVDKDFAVEVEKADADNRYLLENVRYTPGQFTATVSVPFMGYYGYSLLPGSDSFDGPDPSTPYGMYAVLTDEDGTVLSGQSLAGYTLADFNSEEDGNLYPDLAFSALLKPADREKLVLTFYQFDPRELENLALLCGELTPDAIVNPVTAEFTIDLAEGTAKPSRNYQKDGPIKLDSARPLMGDNHPAFENGLYVRGVENEGALVELVIRSETDTAQPAHWALQCFIGDELAQIVPGYDLQELQDKAVSGDDFEGRPVYETDGGAFWMESSAYDPDTYLHLFFLANYPEWTEGPFDRVRLVDMETGEVLIKDVQAAYQKNLRAVLTAEPYK